MSNSTSRTVWYYGYAPRTLPCKSDLNTCTYYEELWTANERGILYSGILWITVGAVLFLTAVLRRTWVSRRPTPFASGDGGGTSSSSSSSLVSRPLRAGAATIRRHFLPDSVRFVFGRTTRLQVLILAILVGYLIVFSFVGMTYAMWPTPVAASPGVWKYQSTLGIWSNRIGILAYALTPFSVLLASRESLLSLLTGIPYQSFNFLHRWTGYVILVQSILHGIAWCVVCIGMYGPQPKYAVDWVTKKYMIYGICAQFLLIFMSVLSTQWAIRLTGFEFFRKSHYVLAMVYLGTCWGHWEYLGDWMVVALVLWGADRAARIIRTILLHHQYSAGDWGFHPARARVTTFVADGDAYSGRADEVVRLDFDFVQSPWKVGQHFYLCFPEASVWQSHPFTPLNNPVVKGGVVSHSYVFRAKRGETGKVARLAARKLSDGHPDGVTVTTPVILQGPYGEHSTRGIDRHVNILAVAGGSGITYVLPVLLELVQSLPVAATATPPDRRIRLVWAVRHSADMHWVEPELAVLQSAAASHNVQVSVYVTRERDPSERSSAEKAGGEPAGAADPPSPRPMEEAAGAGKTADINNVEVKRMCGAGLQHRHPDVGEVVRGFVEQTVRGGTVVYASGPGSMISDLRTAVAALNDGGQVWRGNERYDVELREDNRLEW